MIAISTPVVAARRDANLPKPLLRGWLHLLWFEASLIVGTVFVLHVGLQHRAAAAVYVAAVSALFGTSALYHRGNWQPRARLLLERLDHAMIFVLIAGSATPLFLVAVPGRAGPIMLGGLLALTACLLIAHMVRIDAPEVVVGSGYVGLGCLGAAALPGVWTHVGAAAFFLVLGGGLLYIVGAVLFHRRHPDPVPNVFGFHEVFHCFVCLAATLQYVAIALLVL
jgi:hemolysin III